VDKTRTIAKLQALLARIRSRAREPLPPAAPAPEPAPSVVQTSTPRDPPVPARIAAEVQLVERPPAVVPVDDSLGLTTWSPPAAAGELEPEIDFEVEVEVDVSDVAQAGVVEEVRAAGSPPSADSDSAERLVVAQAALELTEGSLPDETAGALIASGTTTALAEESAGGFDAEEPTGATNGFEDDESAPASSRRPVAAVSENHLTLAFGSDEPEPPRHTPPPESGRLPAPSGEGFAERTAAHEARPDESAQASMSELLPDATRASLESASPVPDVIGEAQRFAPATFLAWLDASIEF
jgi:hypothetical protein